MAVATIIKLDDIADSGNYVNNFTAKQNKVAIPLAVGDLWYYFDMSVYNGRSLYLFLSGSVDRDITVELFRSAGYTGTDTDYAVPVPGASLTMAVAVPGTPERITIDFNIDNFGAERLWMKVNGAAALAAATTLNIANIIIKP